MVTLVDNGADVNVKRKGGPKAFFAVICNLDKGGTQLLIDRGADINECQNCHTPLD